jgi:hypothetical protein
MSAFLPFSFFVRSLRLLAYLIRISPKLSHQLFIRRLFRLLVPSLLEYLQEDKVAAPRQARQHAILADQLAVVVLGDDLISVTRRGVEVRPHHVLDRVCEESELLGTVPCASENVDVYEWHIVWTLV